MKRIALFIFLSIASLSTSLAQCAMCRATIENNFSNGKPGIGAGLNTGILYLLVMPYLAVMILGYFWYKTSRANGIKNLVSRDVKR
jgi:hypothetical protein